MHGDGNRQLVEKVTSKDMAIPVHSSRPRSQSLARPRQCRQPKLHQKETRRELGAQE